MPIYMTQFAYTTRSPEDRSQAVGRLMESLGGRLISFYNSFGEYDGVIIFEAPDEGTAAAVVLAAVSPGHIKAIKTTTLLSVENAMEAMRKAGDVSFRRPGQE